MAVKTLDQVVREHVAIVLEGCGGSVSEAARQLGVDRNTLYRMMRSEPAIADAVVRARSARARPVVA